MKEKSALSLYEPAEKRRAPNRSPSRVNIAKPSGRSLLRVLSPCDFTRLLEFVPHLLLGEIHQSGEHDQKNHDLHAHALARHQVRLGCPHQECGDIFRILLKRLRRTIVVGHLACLQWRRHRNIVAREILVVVPVLRQLEAFRWLLVPVQQRCDIVRPLLLVLRDRIEHPPGETALKRAGLREGRHVGRRNAVYCLGREFIRERRRESIGETTGAFSWFTLIVEILDLILRGNCRSLRFREARTTWIGQVAESQHLYRVADLADFLVNLEAALELSLVVTAERAGKRPLLHWRVRRVVLLGDRRRDHPDTTCKCESDDGTMHLHSHISLLMLSRPAPIPKLNSAAAWFSRRCRGAAG